MFAGHLAVGLAAKRAEPRIPLSVALGSAYALDILWPLFLLLGMEKVTVHPNDTPFTHLAFDSYPWSHSLAAVLGWSILGGWMGRAVLKSSRAGLVIGLLILSHWVLDFVTHRPDLPLWPGGPLVGLGLWTSVAGTIALEATLLAVGVALYLRSTIALDNIGKWAFMALVLLIGTIWVTQPWSPPPPSAEAVAWGGVVMWIIPLWGGWIERHRRLRGAEREALGGEAAT